MIHPTRTDLLILKEKAYTVNESINILKARRQALIKEFVEITIPFLRTREDIRRIYGNAIMNLRLSRGHEGRVSIDSISRVMEQKMGVDIMEKSIWGLKYRDIVVHEGPLRNPDERNYDYISTAPHLEEAIYQMERIVDEMLRIAQFESKLKRLGDEITKTTRRIRILEERILPDLRFRIKTIEQYLAERERESHFRLKRFKTGRGRRIKD